MRAPAAVALAAVCLTAGCGGQTDSAKPDPATAGVTDAIYSAAGAVSRGDTRAACAWLTPRGRRELEQRSGRGCGAAVRALRQRLPGPGLEALQQVVVSGVRVRGSRAAAVAEPPSDFVELARATGVTYPLSARVRLVRAKARWLIDGASAAGR